MKCNVGKSDRMLRVLTGAFIVVLGLYFKSWWGLIGILPILTGTIAWCPGYLPFKISTAKTKNKEEK